MDNNILRKARHLIKPFIKGNDDEFIISKEQDKFLRTINDHLLNYSKTNSSQNKVKILYIPGYYHTKLPRMLDILMAMALRVRGADIVSVITGDFHEKECVIFGGVYNQNRETALKKYFAVESKIWHDLLKIPTLLLKNFRDQNDLLLSKSVSSNVSIENFKEFFYKNFPIGNEAYNVTSNMNNQPNIPLPENLGLLKIHVENIVELMNAYDKIIDQVKPDIIYSYLPFYYKWGVVYHLAKQKGIPFYSACVCERKNSFYFSDNVNLLLDSTPAWNSFKKVNFDQATNTFIDNITSKRLSENISYFDYVSEKTNETDIIALARKIGSGKPVVLFPVNTIFDAAVFRKAPSFDNIVEMLKSTIAFFNKHPQYLLIIKAHPAEKLFYSNSSEKFTQYCLANVIKKSDMKLSDNIIFLDYDTTIKLNDLIPKINTGIVWSSSVAMEMAWMGKPVIALADAHYQSKDFTYQPSSSEDFFNAIENYLTQSEAEETIQKRVALSKKYYYLFYYHSMVDFNLIQGSELGNVEERFLFNSYTEILPGKNEALDYICDSILSGSPVFGDNKWPPLT